MPTSCPLLLVDIVSTGEGRFCNFEPEEIFTFSVQDQSFLRIMLCNKIQAFILVLDKGLKTLVAVWKILYFLLKMPNAHSAYL